MYLVMSTYDNGHDLLETGTKWHFMLLGYSTQQI